MLLRAVAAVLVAAAVPAAARYDDPHFVTNAVKELYEGLGRLDPKLAATLPRQQNADATPKEQAPSGAGSHHVDVIAEFQKNVRDAARKRAEGETENEEEAAKRMRNALMRAAGMQQAAHFENDAQKFHSEISRMVEVPENDPTAEMGNGRNPMAMRQEARRSAARTSHTPGVVPAHAPGGRILGTWRGYRLGWSSTEKR